MNLEINKLRFLILVFIVLFFLVIYGCSNPPAAVLETPKPALNTCNIASDCVLAIRVDVCCSCPEVASRQMVEETDGLEFYVQGQNYGDLRPLICSNVDCAPCPPPPAAAVCNPQGQCESVKDVEEILQLCPSCITQAALSAFQSGNRDQAVEICQRLPIEQQESCFYWLLDSAMTGERLADAEYICREHVPQNSEGCLLQVSKAWAETNANRALSLCQDFDKSSNEYFACIEEVAIALKAEDIEAALNTCKLLPQEKVELCREDVFR